MFQLFRNVSKQNEIRLWKRWKYQAPFLVFWNTETMDSIGKLLKRTETWKKLTKSKSFSCFETFRNKIETSNEKMWKYQAPFLVFRNTETMDYIGKKLKRTETWRKLTESKRFSCFEMFRNKIETNSGKGENTRPHFWCLETLKQWII